MRPPNGLGLLTGSVLASFSLIAAGQTWLKQQQRPLTPGVQGGELWQRYRWSWDPSQRRDAAFLLAAADPESSRRQQHLLQGQGWGRTPTAAAALLRQAQIATRLGERSKATRLWQSLRSRFPDHPLGADALYQLSNQRTSINRTSTNADLLDKHPAHPASLERAVEQKNVEHLAAWGPRHPGAAGLLQDTCTSERPIPPSERQQLALALASLGDGDAGLNCLNGLAPLPGTAVEIGRAMLRADRTQRRLGSNLLITMVRRADPPVTATTLEAARLLSDPFVPDPAVLDQLPEQLRASSADVAAAEVRLGRRPARDVFQRWPKHPASWQLQWDLARTALLAGRWAEAETVLLALNPKTLPEPLQARQRFWLGLSQAKQNREAAAREHWQILRKHHPAGYYTWRASARLNAVSLPPLGRGTPLDGRPIQETTWQPLSSGDALVDRLWRLGMTREAAEIWTSRTRQRLNPQTVAAEPSPTARLIQGRLRLALSDPWNGLEDLWKASLRLITDDCEARFDLHHRQHPRPFASAFQAAMQTADVHEGLLRAIAKQESRYSPGVSSPVGARGLMQLMPTTAAELMGRDLTDDDLIEPRLNTELGARYLAFLLKQWDGNPWLTIASYNAGPGAAERWRSVELETDPELWAERIPYPETRIYTKKVLGNLWAYLESAQPHCSASEQGPSKP